MNEQATWSSLDDVSTWLTAVFNRTLSLDEATLDKFQETLKWMRRQVTALHFYDEIDRESLNSRLTGIHLHFFASDDATDSWQWPRLRVKPQGQSDKDLLEALENTLICQFAFFLSEDQPAGVFRCEGLYREAGATALAPVACLPDDLELLWRKEIPLLANSGLADSAQILRCADIFPGNVKARFCSNECRFRTFQLSKQLSDPAYLAAKQKRYRQKQKSLSDN